MNPRSEAMETPNTRSRRKRELNEEEVDDGYGGTVKWGHDQKLRRMMLQATAGKDLPIPSPTQMPVFGHSPAHPSAGPSDAPPSKPTRRRPCRAHRSLPSQLANQTTADPSSKGTKNRANSVRTQPDDGILGDLLAQALKTFGAQPTASSSSSASKGFERNISSGTSGSSESWVPPLVEKPDYVEMTTLPPPPPAPATIVIPTRPVLNDKPILRNNVRPLSAPRDIPQYTKPLPTTNRPAPPNPTPSVPEKAMPSKSPASRAAPRVGLSSRPRQTITTPSFPNSRPAGASQRFKPPLLQQQQAPIRCSPRRHPLPQLHQPGVAQQTPSKLRGGAQVAQTATGAAPAAVDRSLRSAVVKDAPSSDSVGDESFDSFDGIFEAGGEDIDAILGLGAR